MIIAKIIYDFSLTTWGGGICPSTIHVASLYWVHLFKSVLKCYYYIFIMAIVAYRGIQFEQVLDSLLTCTNIILSNFHILYMYICR